VLLLVVNVQITGWGSRGGNELEGCGVQAGRSILAGTRDQASVPRARPWKRPLGAFPSVSEGWGLLEEGQGESAPAGSYRLWQASSPSERAMEIARILEAAWVHAYPGREAAEQNSMLRQLWKALQPASESARPFRAVSAPRRRRSSPMVGVHRLDQHHDHHRTE
jgi:hypothetical protein